MDRLEEIPPEAAEAIERTRKLVRDLSKRINGHGVPAVDIALGVAYGLHDLACDLHGNAIGAIEWQRSCIDLFERGHLTGGIYAFPKGSSGGDGQG